MVPLKVPPPEVVPLKVMPWRSYHAIRQEQFAAEEIGLCERSGSRAAIRADAIRHRRRLCCGP